MAFKNLTTPVVIGNARFTVYADGCIRTEYANNAKFTPYTSVLIGKKSARPVKALVERTTKKVRIRTPKFELEYADDGQNFSSNNLKIHHKNHEGHDRTWTPGKRDPENLGEVVRSLDQWKWCGGPARYPNQGILSREGGHFLADEPRVYWNTKEDWPQCLDQQVWFDGYFFAYGNDYKGALQDFVNVFGPIPMVPRWTFGFWYSRWHAYTAKEFSDLVKRYQKEKIPIDVMIIDTDWRDNWGGYDWSKKYFSNPKKALKDLHDLGVKTSLNDHPGYDKYDSLPDDDSHIMPIRKKLGSLPHDGRWACDWSNKKALDVWKKDLLGPFFDQGMDFWWIDGWIKSPFGNLDSQLWANEHYFELAKEKTGKRGMILSRWGGIGSHRFPVQFSGDTPSDWNTLKHQIAFTSNSGNLGAAYWSHDIGGFFGRELDEEVFIRWSQFGSMSPVFRTHSDHGIREPWHFSARAKRLFKKQTRIRCALAPYFYNLAREAHETGMPLCRPLYLEYNDNDGGAVGHYDREAQYSLGKDILVVPADNAIDQRTGIYRKRAYFPNETWYALETEEMIFGMDDRFIDIPLDIIPTYIRKGSIIPSQPVKNQIGTATSPEMHFEYYPDEFKASRFELYEDDGESTDYENGRFSRTRCSGRKTSEKTEFTIGAPKGSYKGMPKMREYVVRVLLEKGQKPLSPKVKVGKGPWKPAKAKITSNILAGEIKSQRKYAEFRVQSRNDAVAIQFGL